MITLAFMQFYEQNYLVLDEQVFYRLLSILYSIHLFYFVFCMWVYV